MNTEQAYNDYLTAWLNGIEYEINFWDNFIQTKGKDFNITEEKWKNYIAYEKPFTLNDDLFLEETNFLDVGSGPFSSCGTKTEKTKLTFTAVDPLAFIYEKLREKYSIYIYIQPKTAMVENLSSVFGENSFDIVHMSNSLDHSFDPILGIWQMLWVCKVGGKIILQHCENEAEFENYQGFHQWNLENKDGNFYIWRKDIRINIADVFGDYIQIEKLQNHRIVRNYNKVVIRKNKNVPLHFNDNYPILLEKFLEQICSLNFDLMQTKKMISSLDKPAIETKKRKKWYHFFRG